MTNTFTSEFQPGIYNNLDEKVYRADGALSTSDFKLLSDCAMQFKAQQDGALERVNSEAFRIGSLFHLWWLWICPSRKPACLPIMCGNRAADSPERLNEVFGTLFILWWIREDEGRAMHFLSWPGFGS